MSNSGVIEVLRRLISVSCQDRELAAEELIDVVRSLDQSQVELLAGALVVARLCETDIATQEAQPNALSELKGWHGLREATLMPLRQLGVGNLPGSQAEHFADLFTIEQE